MRSTKAAVVLLMLVFAVELLVSARQDSQTFDEGTHIFAGCSYWKRGDFGVNPEHPPFAKLVATLPLLPLGLPVQPARNIWFRAAASSGGLQFLYSHDADAILFRARAGASIFAIALALVVFFAAREMFGDGPALLALLVLVFEPVILANGALVTTDMGLTACLFAAVYLFYRYIRRPSISRLIFCGVVTGLALGTKHSALIILPMFVVLAVGEILLGRAARKLPEPEEPGKTRRLTVLRLTGALVAIAAIAFTVLWSFYEFRYAARPQNGELVPPTAVFLQELNAPGRLARGPASGPTAAGHSSLQAGVIGFFERHHLLPEAYLYGLTDIAILTQRGRLSFVLGKLYLEGPWFYFPVAFVIKTTLALMVLLILLIWAKDLRRRELRRALLFMTAPSLIYFAVAMHSKLDIGIRHVLPIYPFLIVLAGAGAWSLAHLSRRWAYAVAFILIFDVVSSVRAFPSYLPYSNEVWGGVPETHKYLSDSNVGWASGLKAVQKYVVDRHLTHCWFAYDSFVDPAYYHIPCTPLPTLFSSLSQRPQEPLPKDIEGPVLLGSQALVGFDFGPGEMNPYQQFVDRHPDAVLRGEVLVFNGNFHVPKVAALSHFNAANSLWKSGHPGEAIVEAKAAAELDSNFWRTHELLASLYFKNKQMDEARSEYDTALRIYRTVEPEFQVVFGEPENPFPPDSKVVAVR